MFRKWNTPIGDHFIIFFKWMKTSQVEVMKCRRSANRLRPSSFSHKERRSAGSPPCLGRALLGSQTLSVSELQLITPLLSHQQKIPQTSCFPLCGVRQWFERESFPGLFFFLFFSSVSSPSPPFSYSLAFLPIFNYHPSLNPSFSNLKGYFKRMLIHQMQLSKGTFGKSNNLFCPSSCQKSSWVMFLTQLTETLNINSWPFPEFLFSCHSILLISTDW